MPPQSHICEIMSVSLIQCYTVVTSTVYIHNTSQFTDHILSLFDFLLKTDIKLHEAASNFNHIMFLILVVNMWKKLLPSLMSPVAASCCSRDSSASLPVLKGVATSDHWDICDYTDRTLFSSWDPGWLDKWIFTKKKKKSCVTINNNHNAKTIIWPNIAITGMTQRRTRGPPCPPSVFPGTRWVFACWVTGFMLWVDMMASHIWALSSPTMHRTMSGLR